MRVNSAACCVEKLRLGASGVDNEATKSHQNSFFQWGNSKLPHKIVLNQLIKGPVFGACPPRAVKTCAVRPVFAQVVGELRAADPTNVPGPVKQNASPGEQSEALRRRWKPGQEQNPGPENQDSQHMLEQPRGVFP